MIYLLHGPDTYRSRRKLNEIIEEYRNKSGANFDFYRRNAEEGGAEKLKEALESRSLFISKKLVVIENLLRSKDAEGVFALLPALVASPDIIVVFWEEKISADDAKKFEQLKGAKSQEFKLLNAAELKKWIEKESLARGLSLTSGQREYLSRLGNDLWRISNEMEKLALSGEASDAVFAPENVFALGDVFFSSPRGAIRELVRLLSGGYAEQDIFVYLSNHARTLLLLKHYAERRESLPKNVNIHPFVVKKTAPLLRALSAEDLALALKRFFDEDYQIKTGTRKPSESLLHMLICKNLTRC